MIPELPSPLARTDRILLGATRWLVPGSEREDWERAWQAELWHRSHARNADAAPQLLCGVVQDALWLRTETVSRALTGTPSLCVLLLLSLLLLAIIPAIIAAGSLQAFAAIAMGTLPRIAVESSLVAFVSFATAVTSLEENLCTPYRLRFKARLFLIAKMVLILLLAWMVSMDLTWPVREFFPFTALILQSLMFVVFGLLGSRWSSIDSALRCQHCLCSLASPTRVGRPSWNLLEFNGTELECKQGHGHLSVPEMETSWRQSSVWVAAA
ncbi:MAG TPA: hypothetical protein VGN43_06220 [Steroidobacteraceae bacterium]|jgi:hypothetical protein|nr:hypothetical protein [Steroidobacteraceae bacterium]